MADYMCARVARCIASQADRPPERHADRRHRTPTTPVWFNTPATIVRLTTGRARLQFQDQVMDRSVAQILDGVRDRFIPVRLTGVALADALGPVLEPDPGFERFERVNDIIRVRVHRNGLSHCGIV